MVSIQLADLSSRTFARSCILQVIMGAVCLFPSLLGTAPLFGQDEPLKKYMGRVIAPFMTYHGADWLIRPEREQEEAPSEVLTQLQLKPGMVVCDLGCGNGFYSLPMARAVAPEGKVLAVDIQPEMIQLLKERAAVAGVDNIEPILSTEDDAKLPANTVDLLILVDVYHEFSQPEEMLAAIRQSLKPDGVVALLEYRAEDPQVPIKPLHKMSKRQILKEYKANGFKLVRQYDGLPWQHLMFLGRDEKWTNPKEKSAEKSPGKAAEKSDEKSDSDK